MLSKSTPNYKSKPAKHLAGVFSLLDFSLECACTMTDCELKTTVVAVCRLSHCCISTDWFDIDSYRGCFLLLLILLYSTLLAIYFKGRENRLAEWQSRRQPIEYYTENQKQEKNNNYKTVYSTEKADKWTNVTAKQLKNPDATWKKMVNKAQDKIYIYGHAKRKGTENDYFYLKNSNGKLTLCRLFAHLEHLLP